MTSAKAVRFDQHEQPSLAAPLGETPVAGPRFRRSMSWLVLLSVPLWAVIAGVAYALVQLLG
ncbi:hypothetical protein [Aeromicrobium sp. 179-A 4D2 NHS]|uniref:hypothetical protein n=1 Tax=Aeromicrobium sp. 179-A 4D2 NHS TaxID=3142375 RepID=UPI0039A2C820